jgi:hypothetical protein
MSWLYFQNEESPVRAGRKKQRVHLVQKSSMTTFLERIKDFFRGQSAPQTAVTPDGEAPSIPLDENTLSTLMQQIQLTKSGEYTCAETADLLDEYVELVAGNPTAGQLLPLVKAHLDHCADCAERYEMLLKIIEADG